MTTPVPVEDHCLTVAEVAERLKVKRSTVRRLFMNEPGVIVIWFPSKGKRAYLKLRIPVTVYQRVVTRLTRAA